MMDRSDAEDDSVMKSTRMLIIRNINKTNYDIEMTCTGHPTSHLYHMHITFISHPHHIYIIFAPHLHHVHIAFISHLYHIYITFISHLYHIHITFISHPHHIYIIFILHPHHILYRIYITSTSHINYL